ncbi:T9SS type A sorting domain-containing protein [Aurantibacillus circumpalustris]|uniref:T9SS type A sorting domain-containing protein n=1 Tax=Aurantibacillus circumpalustris TaxID=3036359 RepID=UPI00295A8367|nr:T9SS type A sorting domain-containing protein [Aurantibacillus circumpalustris]
MKKIIFVLSLTLIFNLQAQVLQRTCGTPNLPAQYESWVQSLIPTPGKYGTASVNSVFNIPVIVHIIHNNESINSISATSGNNLNAAQVIDQINILNKDYNGTNADTNLIPAVFKPLLGKFQVNFCLAVVNPTGGVLAEPGIDRINRVAKNWSATPYSQTYINSTVKPNSIWDPNRYLNIWIAPLSNNLLGYATFPDPVGSGIQGLTGTFGSATTDGVVILTSAFGSIGTAQSGVYNKGRTATHEIGHWIGLRHIWGDSNCGTDYCIDTPPAQAANYGCPSFPYKLGTCSGNATGEMTMNYMDYTNDACMYMFTADQKYRAQLILTNSPIRAALITSTVCNLPIIINDIGITYVASPGYSQSINCVDNINPVIKITNYGTTVVNTALITYNVDGVNTQTLNWSGSASPNTSFTVSIPQINGIGFGTHMFSVNISLPNGGTDSNLNNNNNQQQFSIVNNFAFNAPSGTICQGNSIVLTASGAASYSWSTGAPTSSVSLNPSTTTTYTVTGFYGLCNVPKTVTITVQAAPVLTIDKNHVCEGQPTSITASGANSYSWSSGETSAVINVTLSASAQYTLTGSSSAGCVTAQIQTILIDPLPTVTLFPGTVSCTLCNNATISVNASGGTSPYTYNWIPGNITTQTVSDLEIGCYTVTVTDALGCSLTDETCVSFDVGISSQTLSNDSFKIWPNPSSAIFTVEFVNNDLKKVEIINSIGEVVYSNQTQNNFVPINLEAYSNGIYYLRVKTNNAVEVQKIIKR